MESHIEVSGFNKSKGDQEYNISIDCFLEGSSLFECQHAYDELVDRYVEQSNIFIVVQSCVVVCRWIIRYVPLLSLQVHEQVYLACKLNQHYSDD
jgi:hypothetical protein